MPIVQMPDGTRVRFPDDMPPDQIRDMIASRFPDAVPKSDALKQGLNELSAITQDPRKAMVQEQYDNASTLGKLFVTGDPEFNKLPAWKQPLVATNDILDMTTGAFGWRNKATAATRSQFTGKSYDEELTAQRAMTERNRKRSGTAGVVAEIAGDTALALSAAGRGATLQGALGTGAMKGAPGLIARSGLMGVEGGVYGAISGAGNADPGDELSGAISGAGTGLVAGAAGNVAGEAIASTVGKVAGLFNKRPKTIKSAEYYQRGREAYDRAEKTGVIFNNTGVRQLRDNLFDDFASLGYDLTDIQDIAPKALPALRRIQEQYDKGFVTIKKLDTWRKVAENGFDPTNKANNMIVSKIVSRIDELMDAADPATIVMGNGPEAAKAFNEARNYWHGAAKLKLAENVAKRGEIIGGSQLNQDIAGATRRQAKNIVLNDARTRGFTPDEKAGLLKLATGTPASRTLDTLSRLLPTGALGVSGHTVAGYGNLTSGNIPGLALQAGMIGTGYAAKKAGESLTNRSVEDLANIIARGGYRVPAVKNAVQRLTAAKRDTLSRLLMTMGIQFGTAAPAKANP